jgi:hypothetical protein
MSLQGINLVAVRLLQKIFCRTLEKVAGKFVANDILVCRKILPQLCRNLYRNFATTFATAKVGSFAA